MSDSPSRVTENYGKYAQTPKETGPMAGETVITVIGNLTDDPELRFTPSGAAVANFTIASTPRHFDKQTNEWKDGPTLFLRCNIWRQAAEHVTETLRRGMRVIAQGRLVQESYEKDGQKRTATKLSVEEVGPSLKSATAVVTKANGNAPRTAQQQAGGYGQHGGYSQQDPQGDPWATQQNNEQAPW